jgi:hypothetical protein
MAVMTMMMMVMAVVLVMMAMLLHAVRAFGCAGSLGERHRGKGGQQRSDDQRLGSNHDDDFLINETRVEAPSLLSSPGICQACVHNGVRDGAMTIADAKICVQEVPARNA